MGLVHRQRRARGKAPVRGIGEGNGYGVHRLRRYRSRASGDVHDRLEGLVAYEDEGLDVATDGKAWQWGVASVLALALAIPFIPLMAIVIVRDRLR